MKKRILMLGTALLVAGVLLVGVTHAFLASKSRQIVNTFVSGDITLTLTETTGSKYLLVPGTDIDKDPSITVGKGSEACWLFFKAEEQGLLDGITDYSYEDGWTALGGEEGVYWRRVPYCTEDRVYRIIKGDRITVSADATEEKLASLGGGSKLIFLAYAVQCEGIATPERAWEIIKSGGDEA